MKSARLALFAVFGYLLFLQFAVSVEDARREPIEAADFRQLYTAGYMVRSGNGADLYNFELEVQLQNRIVGPGSPLPFDHLAYEALLFAPFSFLKYSDAYLLFAAFNVLLLFGAQRLFRPYLAPLEMLGKFAPEAIFFCFLPMAVTILLGQDSILLLALAVLAFLALDKGHEARAGFLLSLGLFKFQFILPILLLFLLWRRWRFVFGAALGGVAVLCLSVWMVGASGMRAFARTILDMSLGLSGQAQRLKFATFPTGMPNLRGFIDTVGGYAHAPARAIQIAVIVCTLLVIVLASRMRPSLQLAILVAALVSYHGLMHDYSLLALPLGIILVRSLSEKNLVLGIFDMLLFVSPAVLYVFGGTAYYFLMAIPILVLFFLQRSAPQDPAPGLVSS